ncbi:MAG: hypothetical protein HY934_10880 [Candidatus Firestonebacteria bacterium]|nr:hypothetical protein [Candidatus Firestonebacteria bacterium]
MIKKFNLYVMISFMFLLFISIQVNSQENVEDENKITPKKLFEQKCNYCHTFTRATSIKKTALEWKNTVNKMQLKNPKHIIEEEANIIANYLIETQVENIINRVKDYTNPSEEEKKHSPVVNINWDNLDKGDVTISVQVGETLHPMEKDHYIKYIEVYVNYQLVQKITLTPSSKPIIEFKTKIFGGEHIVARIECNKHGIWEAGIR